MTLKEFAKMLDGRTYGNEITKEEEALAKELGLIVSRICLYTKARLSAGFSI